jgi:hypothetical protein
LYLAGSLKANHLLASAERAMNNFLQLTHCL